MQIDFNFFDWFIIQQGFDLGGVRDKAHKLRYPNLDPTQTLHSEMGAYSLLKMI